MVSEVYGKYQYNTCYNQEKLNDDYLLRFNEDVGFFKIDCKEDLSKGHALFSKIDYQLLDKKDRIVNVETKIRYISPTKYKTIFIEKEKWDILQKKYREEKEIPLYINYFSNGRIVMVFPLKDYFEGTKQAEYSRVTINNSRYGQVDYGAERYLLPIKDAIIYTIHEGKYKKVKYIN